jgi:hypothetical protein
VAWTPLALAAQTSGSAYAATARPVEDVIVDLTKKLDPSNMPTVVWFCDVTDDKGNTKIEGTIFQNEDVGLAMKRFRCFKVDVRSMPEGDLKEKYLARELGFHFFDPAGQPALRPLTGKRADSLSTFSSYVDKVWDASYTMRLKDYQKGMKNVLDELDRLDVSQQDVDRKAKRLEEKPNPRLQRELDKAKEELAEGKKKVEEMEKEVVAQCVLKPEFLPEAADETGKKD